MIYDVMDVLQLIYEMKKILGSETYFFKTKTVFILDISYLKPFWLIHLFINKSNR